MPQTDDALAISLLCSRLLPAGTPPLTARDIWTLIDGGISPGTLLTAVPDDLPGRVMPHQVQGRIALRRTWGLVAEELDAKGIRPITLGDDAYPLRLRSQLDRGAPALLYIAGDPDVLETPGVGIVGSRDVSDDGADVARAVASEAVSLGRPVVSGAARGVDRLAMDAAFQADGAVIGFPADSMERLLRQADVRRGVLDGRVVLATPYNPGARFTVGNAMGRNKLIYAQAALTVVISSAEGTGGTWEGATEALDKSYGRVAVWTGPGAGPGNQALVQHGAEPIDTTSALERLLDTPPEPGGRSHPQQLGLAV